MNFIRRSNRGIFIFHATVLKFVDVLAGWKLATNAKVQHNIFKICKLSQKTQGHGV